jgi:signal transduction histidine kinase
VDAGRPTYYARGMENVVLAARAGAVALLSVQAAILVVRGALSSRRSEPLLLAGFIACLALLQAAPPAGVLRLLCALSVSWTAGLFLSRAVEGGRGGASTAACAGALAVLLPLGLLGYSGATLTALRAFAAGVPAMFPLRSLVRAWRGSHSAAVLATLCCGVLLAAAEAWGLAGGPAAPARALAALLLSLCTGWLVFQEGWPARPGWRGRLAALTGAEPEARLMAARLVESEAALEWQNRMVASGILSLGAAHEFKNVLTLIAVSAQHGLAGGFVEREGSLRLVLEHAAEARATAVETLERLSAGRDEPGRRMDPACDLARIIGLLRPALREQGLSIRADLQSGAAFSCRPGDVEQVIVNLVRNSAEAYGARDAPSEGAIDVAARAEPGRAVIEVRDSAGGVPPDAAHRLFAAPFSGKGGTGLGLYLSRKLAERNGGCLEYMPIDGGSLFRLSFPALGQ